MVHHSHGLQGILEEVKVCRRLYPEFAGAGELVDSLYRAKDAFFRKKAKLSPRERVELAVEDMAETLKTGSPVLADPLVDKTTFRDLAGVISREFVKKEPSLKGAMKELDSALLEVFSINQEDSWHVKDFQALMDAIVEKTSVKRDLATLILTLILPSLFDDYYDPKNLQELDVTPWDQGSCPICGTKPHYGLLKDKEGVRMLECWLCGFRRGFPRLKCPYCLNTELEELGFFTVGENESCRVHFCKKCSSYVKIFDLRSSISDDAFLPAHNMATFSHDLFALKEGFIPGSGLKWVNEEEKNLSAN